MTYGPVFNHSMAIIENARQRIIESFLKQSGDYRKDAHVALAGIVILEHAAGAIRAGRNYGQSVQSCPMALASLGMFAEDSNVR
jgi:hypothetical protein